MSDKERIALQDAPRASSLSLLSRVRDRLVVGLDAGAASIKAVACVASRGGLVVLGCKMWRRADYDGSPKRLKGDINAWLRQFRFLRRTVVVGLYGQAIKYRYVSFPQVTPQEFQAAAALEAKSHFLSGGNDHDLCVLTQIYPQREFDSRKVTTGMVIATPRANLKLRRQALAALGMRRANVYALAQAQCHFFSELVEAGEKTHALIDLGAEYVKISILRGKEIFLVRDCSMPEEDADISPYSLIEPSREEPETENGTFADLTFLLPKEFAEAKGPTAVSQQDPRVLLSLDAIGDEIKLTLKYFLANMENSVDAAWVIGGGACAQPAVDYLADLLELPIRRLSLHEGFPIQADQAIRRELETQWPVFYSALSLASVECKKERSGRFTGGPNISITVPQWVSRVFPHRHFSGATGLAIALTILLALVSLTLFISRRARLARLNAEVERLASEQVALDDSVFSMKLRLPTANSADAGASIPPPRPAYWTRLLYELGHHLPDNLRLSQISSQRFEENLEAEPGSEIMDSSTGEPDLSKPRNRAGDQITLKGTAYAHDAIARLLHRLRQVPDFKILSVENITSSFEPATGAFDFTIVIKVYWN